MESKNLKITIKIIGAVLIIGAVMGFFFSNSTIIYASIPIAIMSGAIYLRAKR